MSDETLLKKFQPRHLIRLALRDNSGGSDA